MKVAEMRTSHKTCTKDVCEMEIEFIQFEIEDVRIRRMFQFDYFGHKFLSTD